jgi:hypothetical protein
MIPHRALNSQQQQLLLQQLKVDKHGIILHFQFLFYIFLFFFYYYFFIWHMIWVSDLIIVK